MPFSALQASPEVRRGQEYQEMAAHLYHNSIFFIFLPMKYIKSIQVKEVSSLESLVLK